MQRGYLILIVGGALLALGIAISVIWAGSLGSRIINQNTILNGVSIYPSGAANAITQVTDLSRPLSLVISIESNHNTGQPNPILRETVRNPNGELISTNQLTKQFLTTIKPDVIGKYTLTMDNLGGSLVSVGILFGNLPFVGRPPNMEGKPLPCTEITFIPFIHCKCILILFLMLYANNNFGIHPFTQVTTSHRVL